MSDTLQLVVKLPQGQVLSGKQLNLRHLNDKLMKRIGHSETAIPLLSRCLAAERTRQDSRRNLVPSSFEYNCL